MDMKDKMVEAVPVMTGTEIVYNLVTKNFYFGKPLWA